ncbi:MAG: biotin transport system substrate-specific component [Halobacteriales archaeon]|jgi:biotin transport system substrate-specific component
MSFETDDVELVGDDTTLNLAQAAIMAALISAFAVVGSIPIPLSPVPVSMQVLGVFLAGLLLGPWWGTGAIFLYLAAGAVGAPVFANGGAGLGTLFGHTGGYLWAYPIAALLIGLIVHGRNRSDAVSDVSVIRLAAALVLATVVIYAMGVSGLVLVADLSVEKAVIQGALVFVPGEVLKILAAIGIVQLGELERVISSGAR